MKMTKKKNIDEIGDAKVKTRKTWIDVVLTFGALIILIFVIYVANISQPKIRYVDEECCDQFCYSISYGKSECYSYTGMDTPLFGDIESNTVYCQESAEDIPVIYIPRFIIKDVPKVCNQSQYVNLTTGEKLNGNQS